MSTNKFFIFSKLELVNIPQTREEHEALFKEIAEYLMNHSLIKRGKKYYEIVEIEFYLFDDNHNDVITYPRVIGAGKWYFHSSGVDLTFVSNEKTFGGILIRGIREIGGVNKQIFGPQNCVNELWLDFNAFYVDESEYPIILYNDKVVPRELTAIPRHIPLYNGKTREDKVREWSNRATKAGFGINSSEEEIAKLVFDSKYRFFKFGSIDIEANSWKNYKAKVTFEKGHC